jgi:acyl-CoA synthetase (AMP-forming)/AMP-acid ligase II
VKDLGELFEKHRNNIFLIEGIRQMTFGEFYGYCSGLQCEIKKIKLKTNHVTVQPDNSIFSLAIIFSLISLGITPSLVSRRDKIMPVIFSLDKIKDINQKIKRATLDNISLPLEREILFWTSGTSAKPKEAILTLTNFYFNALASNENIPYIANDRWLLSLPVEHVGGLSIIFRALVSGGTVVLTEPGSDFLPEEITHLSFVATQLYRYQKDPRPLPNLKALLLGGSAIPWDLVEKSLKLGLPIFKSYGMTEMASQVTTTRSQNPEELKTSGRLLSQVKVRINEGQIYVKGPSLFKGYSGTESQSEIFDSDGWFKTKDRGEWTKDGFLNVLGRSDRVFISAGENISPEFIERALLDYPGVLKARVIPEKNDEFGFCPLAFISHEGEYDSNGLYEFLRTRLSGIQIPKRIQDWSQLPDQYRTSKDL